MQFSNSMFLVKFKKAAQQKSTIFVTLNKIIVQ